MSIQSNLYVSVPILPRLIPGLKKGNLFCTFCRRLGRRRKDFERNMYRACLFDAQIRDISNQENKETPDR